MHQGEPHAGRLIDNKVCAPLEVIEPSQRLLVKGGTIISLDPAVGDLAVGDLLIEGSRIAAIAPSIAGDGAEIIDATGMILIPGFVDCHRHSWEGQLRRINPNSNSVLDYCRATHFGFAPHYRPIDNYVGNLVTAAGCIDAGVTTIIDNSHNSRTDAHSDAAIEALLDTGIRALHAPGGPMTGAWDEEGWPFRRIDRLKRKFFKANDQLVTLAMMAQFDKEAWAIARSFGLMIVTEVNTPALADTIELFYQDGLLGPDNIFNHCTALPARTWEILRERRVGVNVCPRSDAQYCISDGGMSTYQTACDHGFLPAFSIDNETSYSGDMFGEMRVEFFLQRAMTQRDRFEGRNDVAPPVMIRQLLESATMGGATCAGMADRIGSLTPGKQADIVMIRTDDINLYPSNNALGTVVQAAERSNIDTVIIGGRTRKRGGEIVGLDQTALRTMIDESRSYLFREAKFQAEPFGEMLDGFAHLNPPRNSAWPAAPVKQG